MKSQKPIQTRFLGLLAGFFVGSKKSLSTLKNPKNDDFQSNTQKIGVRFTEKIRDRFRGRWIKIH